MQVAECLRNPSHLKLGMIQPYSHVSYKSSLSVLTKYEGTYFCEHSATLIVALQLQLNFFCGFSPQVK